LINFWKSTTDDIIPKNTGCRLHHPSLLWRVLRPRIPARRRPHLPGDHPQRRESPSAAQLHAQPKHGHPSARGRGSLHQGGVLPSIPDRAEHLRWHPGGRRRTGGLRTHPGGGDARPDQCDDHQWSVVIGIVWQSPCLSELLDREIYVG